MTASNSTLTETTLAAAATTRAGLIDPRALAVLALFSAAMLGVLDLTLDASRIVKALGDTDDATRLTQVREFMSGGQWFDTTLPRFGAPQHLVSHWSRLIDAPLALLIGGLSRLTDVAAAETITRFVWPLALLAVLAGLIGRIADTLGGRRAGVAAIVLTVTCIAGLGQFMPGRIDHHSGMIIGAVTGVLLLCRSIAEPRLGLYAGVALGLGTAIGYEALALTIAALALATLYALVLGRGVDGVANTAAAFAGTLGLALLATTSAANLFASHCDALSFNLVLLAASAAAGVRLVATRGHGWPLAHRLAVVAGFGVVGIALYAFAQPACLKGPFGELDPAIGPLWLVTVVETKSLLWMLQATPAIAVVHILFAGCGLWCAWRLWRSRRDDTSALLLATLGAALLLGAWQIKLIPYASFLAVLPIARIVASIDPMDRNAGQITGSAKRILALIAINQFTLFIFAGSLANALVPVKQDVVDWLKTVRTCIASSTVTPLASLPPGLVFADRDLGPFIVALTANRVVSAPYHRLDRAIIESDTIFNGKPEAGEARLKALGVTYVAICPGLTPASEAAAHADGLHGALMAGRPPAYLEAVPLQGDTPLKVWRLKP